MCALLVCLFREEAEQRQRAQPVGPDEWAQVRGGAQTLYRLVSLLTLDARRTAFVRPHSRPTGACLVTLVAVVVVCIVAAMRH